MKKDLIIYNDNKINYKKTISLLILIMLFSGVFGFLYETLFYRIDLGYFVKRGTTYGPWIPIYFFGGLLITLLSINFIKKPCLVFIINTIATGLLEYITGYLLDNISGLRLWDYNNEILNFGNINGYVCLRSVLFFGLSSLFLMYVVFPFVKKIVSKLNENKVFIFSIIMFIVFISDMILFRIFK